MTEQKPTKKHHHGNLKEALVLYTLSAADRGDLAELSVRKAARDLGVSPGAAYRHFPDKDALIREVAQRGFDALADKFESVVPFESRAQNEGDARSRFHALAQGYVDFARDRTDLWRLMFGPLGRATHPADTRPSTYDWLAKSLDELARFGVISPPNPEKQFFAWSAIHGLSDLQSSPAIGMEPGQSPIQQHCDYIVEALAK